MGMGSGLARIDNVQLISRKHLINNAITSGNRVYEKIVGKQHLCYTHYTYYSFLCCCVDQA